MTIRIAKPGLFTTVQDFGRYGCAHLGISSAGAADPLSLRLANLLVGNDESAAALEMTLLGATLEFEEASVVALAGATCDCRVGSEQAPIHMAFDFPAGTTIKCGSMTTGARCYLAIQGGVDVPLVMGSASTFVPGGFGGIHGRRLQSGDELRVRRHDGLRVRSLRADAIHWLGTARRLRVTKGVQQDWFEPAEYARFLTGTYIVSEQSNRSGVRLKGEAVRPRQQAELLTEGVSLGAIQLPPDGQPIILSVDQQTTGGYPKLANVISADIHRVGQLRPRDEVRFAEVSIDEAVQAIREQDRWLKEAFTE
jgi:antagonist of KipI